MGYNVLSGSTSVINATVSGAFIGDGSQLDNVKQFELQNEAANLVPFYKTIGSGLGLNASNAFTFNAATTTLTVPALTASAGLNVAAVASGTIANTSSFLAVDSNGNMILTVGGSGGGGGINYSRTVVTGTFTSSVSDTILGVSATASLEIRLASAAVYDNGQYFTVKDEAGNCNTNNITVKSSGSQTIDGQNSIVLESPFAAVTIYSNGVDKFFIY